ncbi:MAG: fused MFS/spermidine synthase, partial [Planctomycetaceae bacterium]
MRILLWLMVFASGATSLIYQISWVRSLSIGFGNTTYAISTVLTVFMAGLASGYHLFGRRSDQHTSPLKVYATLEFLLGIWAALLAWWLPAINSWTLSVATGYPGLNAGLSFLVSVGCLLPPCTLLGGTLPVLSRTSVRHAATRGAGLTQLYACNTLGAVAGCVSAAFLLIRQLGLTHTMLLAAGTNTGLALLAWCLSTRQAGQPFPASACDPQLSDTVMHARRNPQTGPSDVGNRNGFEISIVAFASGGLLMATE